MLDPSVTSLADRLIAASAIDQRRALSRRILAINQDMTARGAFNSGMRIRSIRQACIDDIAARAQLIFNQLLRALEAVGFPHDATLASDLKAEFRRHLRAAVPDWEKALELVSQRSGMPAHADALGEAVYHMELKFDAEIDVAIHTLARTKQRVTALPPVMNFFGAVGAVQTGQGAHAVIRQQVSSDDRARLASALAGLRSAIQQEPDLSPVTQAEVLEVASDVEAEAKKDQPNLLRNPVRRFSGSHSSSNRRRFATRILGAQSRAPAIWDHSTIAA